MKRLLNNYLYIFTMHVLMLLVLSVLRGLTMYAVHDSMNEADIPLSLYMDSFLMGLRQDNIVVAYTSVLPFLMLTVSAVWYSIQQKVMRFTRWYYVVMHILLLLIVFSNIPYSKEFLHPVDLSALMLLNNGIEVVLMLLSDWHFYIYIIISAIFIPIYCHCINFIGKKFTKHVEKETRIVYAVPSVLLFLFVVALIVLSFRGFKTEGHPLNSTDAYISESHYINLCTQSPTLYFVNSISRYYRLNSVSFYSDDELDKNAKEFFGSTFVNVPWMHEVTATDSALFVGNKPNIVLIFLESMSTHYMQSFGQEKKLTPFLDSLYQNSLHFSNCYSAGFRTGQGILGTLCSWPSIMNRNITHEFRLSEFGGLATELSKEGYSTTCFISHDPNFDGLYDFLTRNGIRKLYSMNDYPADKSLGTWGVPDGFLYDFAINAINNKQLGYQNGKSNSNAPFFASILTISNHPPYDLPKDFHGTFDTDEYNAIQYTDNSLRRFFDKASREPWYDNTVFVLVGDHGLAMEKKQECELPDMINHVPLIVYGKGIPVREYTDVVSQNDIAATLLAMIGHSYTTNSLSYDVLNAKHEYIVYSDGEHIACRDKNYLFLFNYNNNVKKYYKVNGYCNVTPMEPNEHLSRMERYCFTTYQLELNQLKQRMQ